MIKIPMVDRFLFGADSPDIAERVIKSHKEHKMTTICHVAKLISETPCKTGVANWRIAIADPEHQMSGTQRLRELAKRFLLSNVYHISAYYYDHNRYYPTAPFKRFCAKFVRERT